jgi:hypothetical protein
MADGKLLNQNPQIEREVAAVIQLMEGSGMLSRHTLMPQEVSERPGVVAIHVRKEQS